ncbi:hypothetical protein DXG01_017120 [Tephrocybe rancida]|nr:hypothetical protein DXG01_017120 [Tephrocybe rancida]
MRFPCAPSLAARDAYMKAQTGNLTTDVNGVAKPTRGEYAGEAAKEFLTILEAVAVAVPVPGFGIVVKLALNIIKACEESHATLERAQELKDRTKVLVLTLVDKLKGKTEGEIGAQMVRDIGTLQIAFHIIEAQLSEIAAQRQWRLILFKSLNEDKVRRCVAKLNTSLESFELARNIEHTTMFTKLEQQIATFYAHQQQNTQTLNEVHAWQQQNTRTLNDMQLSIVDVRAMLAQGSPAHSTSSQMRALIPANTHIFHGRDTLVAELVGVLIGSSRRHICLLGPGGMGKTSTSQAVMNHPDVEAHFAEHLRVWVPCVKAPSTALLIDTLCTSLGISTKSGNPLSDILSVLRTSPPIVLVLDNFETPWSAAEGQSEVEQVVRDINQIPHVTLFVTIRSSSPPCEDLPWHCVDLPAVDATAARDIYISWYPKGNEGPGLPGLLELIGNMPLAVMLMAKFAALTGLSAEDVAEKYKALGTVVMGQGLDAKTSMDICIGLSVNSPRMAAHPEAFELLCAIAMLPAGTSYEILFKWWARDLIGGLGVLKDTSLVAQNGSTIFVLPVIQRYILHDSRFSKQVGMSMIESACRFLEAHASDINDELYKSHSAAVSAEEGNLEAVLLTTPDSRAIQDSSLLHIIRDGFLLLARHQRNHSARVNIIERALHLVRHIDDNILQGDLLFSYGESLNRADRNNGRKQLEAALGHFSSASDRVRAAKCRLNLVYAMAGLADETLERCQEIIMDAQADCEATGDEGLAARCLVSLGILHFMLRKYPTALDLLTQAEPVLARVKDWEYHAECSRVSSWVHYYMGQYDLAYACAASALEEYDRIGDAQGCAGMHNDIGDIFSARGDFEGSLRSHLRSLEIRKSLRLPPLPGALRGMGLAWAKLGKVEDARQAFEELLQRFARPDAPAPSPVDQSGIVCTQLFLRRLEDLTLKPTQEEYDALRVWYSDNHIEEILTPAP